MRRDDEVTAVGEDTSELGDGSGRVFEVGEDVLTEDDVDAVVRDEVELVTEVAPHELRVRDALAAGTISSLASTPITSAPRSTSFAV